MFNLGNYLAVCRSLKEWSQTLQRKPSRLKYLRQPDCFDWQDLRSIIYSSMPYRPLALNPLICGEARAYPNDPTSAKSQYVHEMALDNSVTHIQALAGRGSASSPAAAFMCFPQLVNLPLKRLHVSQDVSLGFWWLRVAFARAHLCGLFRKSMVFVAGTLFSRRR